MIFENLSFFIKDTYSGDINDPLSLNLYTYCANDPIKYTDPSGHIYISVNGQSVYFQPSIEEDREYAMYMVDQGAINPKAKVEDLSASYDTLIRGKDIDNFDNLKQLKSNGTIANFNDNILYRNIFTSIGKNGKTTDVDIKESLENELSELYLTQIELQQRTAQLPYLSDVYERMATKSRIRRLNEKANRLRDLMKKNQLVAEDHYGLKKDFYELVLSEDDYKSQDGRGSSNTQALSGHVEYSRNKFNRNDAIADVAFWTALTFGAGALRKGISTAGEKALQYVGTKFAQSGVSEGVTSSLWTSLTPGVQVRKFGNWWAKRVNPDSNIFMQWWGQKSINAQKEGLQQLGDMATEFEMRNGILFTRNVGPTMKDAGMGFSKEYFKTWWNGSKKMGTLLNDLRPRNIGANGKIFDPAFDPITKGMFWGGVSAVGGYSCYQIYKLYEENGK